jgi:predicted nucleic-acid-binding Zn-ribbon protein
MDLKPCPHCGGKNFESVPGDYGLSKLGDISLQLPVKVDACTSCGSLNIRHDKTK